MKKVLQAQIQSSTKEWKKRFGPQTKNFLNGSIKFRIQQKEKKTKVKKKAANSNANFPRDANHQLDVL